MLVTVILCFHCYLTYVHCHSEVFSTPYGHCHSEVFSAPYGRCHSAVFSTPYAHCHSELFSAPCHSAVFLMFTVIQVLTATLQ